jgi:hypothetical protein
MSELRKMTRMGGDLRKIARLLQDKGRNGDTILAHINPREAALLREQGGAGDINPETGLPEFYDDDYGNPIPQTGYENVPEGLFEGAAYIPESTGYESVPEGLFEGAQYVRPEFRPTSVSELDLTAQAPQETFAARGAAAGPATRSLNVPTASVEPSAVPQARPAGAPTEKSFLESLQSGDKARLGLGALGGLQTALTARKARQGSQQGAQQIRDIGAPYQQRGLAEQAAAARGELTPVNQQALEAQRARAAQAGVARGGVGIAQQQRAEEDLRNRLLAAQQDFGLKLSGIADQYTAKAIQEGIRADSEISAMYGQYFGNLTRLAAPTIIQSTQPVRG